VFLTPPWPEIYVSDAERQHGFDEAIAEYHRLLLAFQTLGYETIVLPKIAVHERADFVLSTLG
jgi:predicted ATPase